MTDGIYCPSYVSNIYMQYFDVYFIKYLGSVVKLCIYILEFSISLSRCRKNVKIENKLFKYTEKLSFKMYALILVGFSFIFNIIIRIGYAPNIYYSEDSFPYMYYDFKNCRPNPRFAIILEKCNVYIAFLWIYYFVTIILTTLSIIFVDLFLVYNVRKTNKKKVDNLNSKNVKSKMDLKVIDDCKKRDKRITAMILSSTLAMMILRTPELYETYVIIDKYMLVKWEIDKRFFDYEKLAYIVDYVFALNSFAQFLIYFRFNSKFRESFKLLKIFK